MSSLIEMSTERTSSGEYFTTQYFATLFLSYYLECSTFSFSTLESIFPTYYVFAKIYQHNNLKINTLLWVLWQYKTSHINKFIHILCESINKYNIHINAILKSVQERSLYETGDRMLPHTQTSLERNFSPPPYRKTLRIRAPIQDNFYGNSNSYIKLTFIFRRLDLLALDRLHYWIPIYFDP
jgi:hypothetical protein